MEKWLLRVGCPVRVRSGQELVGETRLQVLEWLLRAFDEELAEQCAREVGVRTSRLARQLHVLGLGGVRAKECEAFVVSGGSEETRAVVKELCELVELARVAGSDEQVQEQLARDVEFPRKVAANMGLFFGEPESLFPPALLQKVNFEEKIEADELVAQLTDLLQKLQAKISGLEAQSQLDKRDVFVDPKAGPELAEALRSFGSAVQKFNAVYRSEIALWKVTPVRPNAELAELALKVRQHQKQMAQFLDSFQKMRTAVREIEQVGKEAAISLAAPGKLGPQLNGENGHLAQRLATTLK